MTPLDDCIDCMNDKHFMIKFYNNIEATRAKKLIKIEKLYHLAHLGFVLIQYDVYLNKLQKDLSERLGLHFSLKNKCSTCVHQEHKLKRQTDKNTQSRVSITTLPVNHH
eukprot:8018967-Ditylum_brightwellii.AAC.1